jgi:membrane protease YdiL (CAAX protease family)
MAYGIIIGIGEMGLSTMLCMVMIRILQVSCPNKVPHGIDAWSTLSRGGWIRHHLHTIKLLPITAALFVIFLQLFSEEIFFRGIIINALIPYSYTVAAIVSITLFIYMQTFHMPSKITAMFPVIGSTVMGIVHTYLYLKIPQLLPLIIAHFIFFVSAVL